LGKEGELNLESCRTLQNAEIELSELVESLEFFEGGVLLSSPLVVVVVVSADCSE